MRRSGPASVAWTLRPRAASSYRDLASSFKTNIRQISDIVHRVHDLVIKILGPKYLRWGRRHELDARRARHRDKIGLDGVIGYIDGSHFPIRVTRPIEHIEAVNRKGWHSAVAQAIVDYQGRFLDVAAGFYGNCSDRYVFNVSPIGRKLMEDKRQVLPEGAFIIGDAAYRDIPGIVVPFPPPCTPAMVAFNAWLSGIRQVVEAAFGAQAPCGPSVTRTLTSSSPQAA